MIKFSGFLEEGGVRILTARMRIHTLNYWAKLEFLKK